MSTKKLALIIPVLGSSEPVTQVLLTYPYEKILSMGFRTTVYIIYTPTDGSKIPTFSFSNEFPLEILVEPKKGYGQAYITAFAKIKADFFVCVDGDMTYPLFLLPKMLSLALSNNLLFVSTNRLTKTNKSSFSGWNLVGNKLLSYLHHLLLNLPFKDTQSGFWIITSSLINQIKLKETSFLFSSEIKLEAFNTEPSRSIEVTIPYFQRKVPSKSVNKFISGIRIGLFTIKRSFKRKK